MAALKWAWGAWQRFFFAPVPATSIGVMRLSLGLLLVMEHLWLWPQLSELFSATGPVPAQAARGELPWPRLTLLDAVVDPRPVWLIMLVVYLLFAAGLGGRVMAVLALVAQVLLYHRDPFYQHGGDRVLRLVTLYLCLVPCTAALSLDAWRARRSKATVPILAHRLIQIQLAVIYMSSGYVKLHGHTWRDGTALYYALSDGQYTRAPWLLEPLLRSDVFVWFSRVATWITLGWEAAFGLLLLWRPTRRLALVIGLLVHGGIFFNLSVGSFSLIMLWSYQSLVDPAWVDRLLNRWQRT